MRIRTCIATLGFVMVAPCFGQTSQSDSQTLQAILNELKQIHEETRVTQTTQILLAEPGTQQGQVNRAQQRVDEAQSRLSQTQTDRKHFTGELARSEHARNEAADTVQKKQLTETIESLKLAFENQRNNEQESSSRLEQAQEQLRNAETALDEIQGELNTIVKRLPVEHAKP
jgi:chromosome segregation ATPase